VVMRSTSVYTGPGCTDGWSRRGRKGRGKGEDKLGAGTGKKKLSAEVPVLMIGASLGGFSRCGESGVGDVEKGGFEERKGWGLGQGESKNSGLLR